ncbi:MULTISPECIES: ABC transporter permease [Marinomonas]|uniref:Spermidine/putrescine transport system permease protein n=2 Tax=Marinomonas TaxID=28253 RepID=A0A366D7N3_9GAMM|nr:MULTISPECIES: ABC transporter permease [Marinomonas]AEF53304.1 ABC-type transporter, integral membrane subunit [Marinomonas posidonica IVIA-Po-181]RBO86043.1 spermidine/putrescine transport system permease protein [Marinomonas aquiplantarum]
MNPLNLSRKQLALITLLTPTSLFLLIFFIGPMLIMLTYSFLEPGLYGGVEWHFYHWNYGRVLGWADGIYEEFDPVYLKILLRSIGLSVATVLCTLFICYPVAFWVSTLSAKNKALCIFLMTLPFFASMVVRLYAWVLILRNSGFANQFLEATGLITEPLNLMFSGTAVIIGMVYIFIPFMFLPIYSSVEKLDKNLLQASEDLGATPFTTFRRVVFPLTLPGIVAGCILVFIPSLGNFVVPDLLGGAKVLMIGNMIEQQFLYARNWPFGATLSMVIIFMMMIILSIYLYKSTKKQAGL